MRDAFIYEICFLEKRQQNLNLEKALGWESGCGVPVPFQPLMGCVTLGKSLDFFSQVCLSNAFHLHRLYLRPFPAL